MDSIEGLAYGLGVVFAPENLLAAFVGVFLGTAIGVLPGLGSVAGAALILPLTFHYPPVIGVILIAGIYTGSMYGSSTTAVLLNVPGDSASVVTTLDGYKLAQKGRAGPVLAVMAVGSFVAGTFSLVLVTLFTPFLADLGLSFGPAEFFALTAGGLIALARVSGGTLVSNLFPLMIGLLLGTVGQDQVSSQFRFTFGYVELAQGISLITVAVGLFGISEMLFLVEGLHRTPRLLKVRLRQLMPSRSEWRRSVAPWTRGASIGFGLGLLPGPSATLSSFLSYKVEKTVAKHRKEIGEGAIEGVAGPEAANNAAATSSIVPVLSLGIPFSATLALMLAALLVQGVDPGPLLVVNHPEIFWGVIAAMWVGNVMLLVLNLPLVGIWVRLLQIPMYVLIAMVLVFATIGAFSGNNSMLDVRLMVLFGLLGYILRKLDFGLAPVILGLVLGPFVEKHLREGLRLGNGEVWYLFTEPIAMFIWLAVLGVFAVSVVRRVVRS